MRPLVEACLTSYETEVIAQGNVRFMLLLALGIYEIIYLLFMKYRIVICLCAHSSLSTA